MGDLAPTRSLEEVRTLTLCWFVAVVGNDGFYVILKGLARAQTQLYKSLIEEEGSSATIIPQSFHSYVCSEDLQPALDRQGALCGTLVRWLCFSPKQQGLKFQKCTLPEQSTLLQGTLKCLR